jgi:DNA-binding winged helix-turn-helix (wHTH) protein
MDSASRRSFGPYDIDLTTGELRRGGVPVPLQRQPALVLARLVASAGTLVPREALHAAVWGDRVHVDFDRGLNYCIRQLRETLDDDARAPRFIETVARQGYRFVAPVASPRSGEQNVESRRVVTVAAVVTAVLVASLAVDRATGRDERHHQMAVAVVRALHDVVF